MLRILTVLLISVLSSTALFSQFEKSKKNEKCKIVLKNGNVFIGEYLSEDSTSYSIDTEAYGQITIKKDEVKKVQLLNDDQYRYQKRRISRRGQPYSGYQQNLQGQTGFGPKAGEFNYRNVYVIANDVEVGITDYFSLQGGFTWTFLFPEAGSVVWLTPKVHYPIVEDKISTSLSYFYIRPIGQYVSSEDRLTFLQSSTSIRIGESQFSTGIGFGKNGYDKVNMPLFSLSAQIRINERSTLITENYFVRTEWQNVGFYSLAFRFGKRNAKFDLGLAAIHDEYGDVYPVPVLDVRVPLK